MIRKVTALTSTFLAESNADKQQAAALLSNFLSQKVVQPFVFREDQTPVEKFGKNVVATVKAAKKSNRCSGTPADMLRRTAIVCGAHGPLSKEKVCSYFHFACLL